MRSKEVTADIPEEETSVEEVPEETEPEKDDPVEETQEDDPEETDTEETTSEETTAEETTTEEISTEETTQEKTATKKDTIQEREEIPETLEEVKTEYTSPASDLEYDVFEQILAEQQMTNTLLVRITNQNDLFLGIGVALIICCICYSVLERFTRF